MAHRLDQLKAALAGRYEIERELGQGGMATVYLARDVRHDRLVALKVMHPELAAVLGAERFLREIQISARLHHPHILPLYDSGDAAGFLFYVMPFVEGESLRNRLDRERQLPVDDAVRIASEVADALAYAHSHDVVHRDIKPGNILLESGHAVVADFGIARAITSAGGNRLTETGLAVGTPVYMSPEQAAGDSQIDGRSDIYSLGCVLYEALAGQPPHAGGSAQAIIAKRLTEEVPNVTAARSTVPAEVERAVAKALARVPADRFTTAADFAAALSPDAAPSTATPTGPVAAASRGRSPWLPAAASALALLALVVVIVLLARGSGAGSPSPDGRPTLAVLPFENIGAPENEYFADGITEEMTSRLAEISALSVTSRTSTLRYKGTTRSLREIGADLGVEYVLEGTVRTDRSPDGTGQVRVTPQLIRVRDDSHLWTDRYTASLAPGEIFAVQAEIAEQVAMALNVTLLGSERIALRDVPTSDPEAHDAYLLGRFHWNKRGAENLQLAARHFGRAIELDPDFAEAYTGLADTYALYGYYAVPGVTRAEAYARAETAARRAIALDSALAAAHASLGNILTYGAWDWEGAEREFRRAIALDPQYPVTRYWYAELLIILGRTTEAIEQAEHAVASDPASVVARHILAIALTLADRSNEAAAQERVAIQLVPTYPFAHSKLATSLIEEGEFNEAIREFQLAGIPSDLAEAVVEAVRDTTARRRAVAVISRHEREAALGRNPLDDPAVFGFWYGLVGVVDSVFARLETAYQARTEQLIFNLRHPVFDPFRSDPRFADLLRRLRLAP